MTDDCNAWFFCEDDRGCEDWQTQLVVEESQCVLMSADARPQPEPQRNDVSRPFGFSSFQAGFLKGVCALQHSLITSRMPLLLRWLSATSGHISSGATRLRRGHAQLHSLAWRTRDNGSHVHPAFSHRGPLKTWVKSLLF